MERTRCLVRQTRWKAIKTKGFWRFVLVRGGFGWGGLLFLSAFLSPLLSRRHPSFDPVILLVEATFNVATGLFIGAMTWRFFELRYPDPLP